MLNKDAIWEYDVNNRFDEVLQWMEDNDAESIVDLGAGLGDCLLKAEEAGFKVAGFENDPALLDEAPEFVYKKDILKLFKKDIEDFDVIYSWEPFKHPDKTKEFLKRVYDKMEKGQVLIYRAQKHMPRFLPFEKYGNHFVVVK